MQKSMPFKIRKILSFSLVATLIGQTAIAPMAYGRPLGSDFNEAPLIAGPGLTADDLETFADSESRVRLADHLDHERPGAEASTRLRGLLERAQKAWLTGSIDSARVLFTELTAMALDADWKEPQRESLHYAFIRLAQSSVSSEDRVRWIEKAIRTFPDIQPDSDLFPPPLVEEFRQRRTTILAESESLSLAQNFQEFRFLLVNGKKFVVEAERDLKIRLPQANFRITALSDTSLPFTIVASRERLKSLRPSMAKLGLGTCSAPSGAELFAGVKALTVVYSTECTRTRTERGWVPKEINEALMSNPTGFTRSADVGEALSFGHLNEKPKEPLSRKTWFWAGVTAIAAGTAYVLFRELNRAPDRKTEVQIKPTRQE